MAYSTAGDKAIYRAQILQLAREVEVQTNIRRMEIARERYACKTDSVAVVAGSARRF